jgi:hypothetical protein
MEKKKETVLRVMGGSLCGWHGVVWLEISNHTSSFTGTVVKCKKLKHMLITQNTVSENS